MCATLKAGCLPAWRPRSSHWERISTLIAAQRCSGADFDLTPRIRASLNVNHLWFADTAVVRSLRNEGSIPRTLGWDYSASVIWRPKMTQNLVFRASAAVFDPSAGFGDLFTNSNRDSRYYSVLLNAILNF